MESASKVSKRSAALSSSCSKNSNIRFAVPVLESEYIPEDASQPLSAVNSSVCANMALDPVEEARLFPTCLECRHFELQQRQLKKEQRKITRMMLAHRRLTHKDTTSTAGEYKSSSEKTPVSGDAGMKLLAALKARSVSQPPRPGIRRLKGDVAKHVGEWIDGSFWSTLQPGDRDDSWYSGPSVPRKEI